MRLEIIRNMRNQITGQAVFGNFLKLSYLPAIIVAVLFLFSAVFFAQPVLAAVNVESQPLEMIPDGGDEIKALSQDTAILSFALSQTAGETLSSVTVTIVDASSTGVTSSEIANLKVFKDDGDSTFEPGTDDLEAGSQTTVNIGSATTITTSLNNSIGASSTMFFVSIATSASWSDAAPADAIKVNMASNGIVTSANSPTVNAVTGVNALTADTTPPAATGVGGPPDGQQGVPADALVDRSFNDALDINTVNTTNVLLQTNTGNVQGGTPTGSNLCTSVSLSGGTQITCSHANLTAETWYTFTITTGVQDNAGNALASDFTSQFKVGSFTGGTEFNPPPFVLGTMPFGGASLPSNGKILVDFSMPMQTSGEGSVLDVNNIKLFLLSQGAPTGSNLFTSTTGWSYATSTDQLKIVPPTLTVGNSYRLVIKGYPAFDPASWDTSSPACGGPGEPACVLSTDNLPIPGPDYILDFQVAAADNTGPSVLGSFPDNNATGTDRVIYDFAVSMNEAIDAATVTAGTATSSATVLMLRDDGDGVAEPGNYDLTTDVGEDTVITTGSVVVEPDGRTIHYSVNGVLNASAKHFLVLRGGASGIKDLVGNAMSADVVRTFTTGTNTNGQATDNTAPTVKFANADNFGVFVTFSEPVKFDATANNNETTSNGANDANNLSNWTLQTSPDGTNWITVNLSGKNVFYESYTKTLEIDGLMMSPGENFRVTASTNIQDLAGNGVDASSTTVQGTVQHSFDTGGQLGPGGSAGGPDYYAMGTNPIMVFPKSAMAGVTTRYRVEFTASSSIPASGKITLTFPSGFSFANSCATWPTDTFENLDINGPSTGTVTVASISCDSVSRVVTVTLGSTATQAQDRISFEIQGVINSTVPKDYSSNGYTVDIKTYNTSNTLLQSLTSMPFFISAPGNNTVQGKVFVDANSNNVLDGGESGVDGSTYDIKVCLGGPMGFDCKSIDASGDYSFTSLPDGFYSMNLPPISSGSYTGGPFFRDVNVSGGQNVTENFPLKLAASQDILDVYVSGGPSLANTKIDIFAFSSSMGMQDFSTGPAPGGFVVREATLNGSGVATSTLPLSQGKWQVGVGPWMPKDPGTPPSPPDFTFMPPKPVEVSVTASGTPDLCTSGAGAASELCFTLTEASNQIKGKVVDGSGNAIANVFVMARPAFMDKEDMGAAGVGQTDANGLFNIKTVTGTFVVDAFMPGMPPSNSFECTVKDNTSASDNNSTADVYCNGVLIVNDIAGFSGPSITVGNITSNDLILKIAKGDTSISGRVLDDSGNAIAFAHVNGMEVDSSGNPLGGWADAPTDNSGNYTLYVAGGTGGSTKTWKIKAFAPGFGELPSITVSVTSGQNLTGKNLQVPSGEYYTVSGSVTQGGTGIQGAFVQAYGPCGGNGTVTNASGDYTLKLRGTGSCTSASGDDESYTIEGFVPGQGPTSVLTNVDVTGNLTGQNLTMAQPGTVVVYVCQLDEALISDTDSTKSCSSRIISNAFVDARDSQGRGTGTASNPTAGEYELVVPAGTYTVKANSVTAGFIGSASVTVVGGATRYVNIEPPALYTVQGTVTSSSSACVEGATVFLSDSSNGRVILTSTNASGSWSVSNVPVGAYSVGAGKPGCVDAADPEILNVSGNSTATTRTLTAADATITGQVTLNGSNVSFDTMVFATSAGGKKVVTRVDTSATSTNNYTLNLTAGTWTVQARSDGYQSSSASVTVASGGSETQNLTLSAISGYTRKEPKPYSITPSQGGIIKNTDIGSDFEVNIPAGALGTSSNEGSVLTKETTAVADTSTQTIIGNKAYQVTPKDASGQPIKTLSSSSGGSPTITIPYSETDVSSAGSTESKLVISVWSDEKQDWEPLPTTCDTTNNKCTATISHFSEFALSSPSAGGAPSAPTGVTATQAGTNSITVSWNAVSGATGYDVYRDTSPTGSFPRLGSEPTTTGTSYTDTGLSIGTTYYYKVSAINSSGESAASSAVSASTPAPYPGSGGGGGGGAAPTAESEPEPEKELVAPTKPITQMTVAELRAEIVRILGLIAQLRAQLAQMQGVPAAVEGIPADYVFGVPLRYGQTSDDVRYLQEFLKAQGAEIYPEGLVTGYFGPLTKAAVIRFQEKYSQDILAPWGLTEGTGFVGRTTIAKINELLGR